MGTLVRTVLALVVILALISSTFAVFAGYDGRPRPDGFDDKPTNKLGAKPAVKYAGKPANCIWYSWENYAYMPNDTKACSSLLWEALTADPSGLAGFEYYAPSNEFYDPGASQYLCVIGCFDLSAGGPASSPAKPPVAATPPVIPPVVTPPVMPPPAVAPAVPPTTPPSMPPPMMAPPPPATLFRPPPPGLPLPPSSIAPPTNGAAQAPGPASQTSAGSAVRIFSGAALFVLVVAIFELVF